MLNHDHISDVFSKIWNAQQSRLSELTLGFTTFNKKLVDLLCKEGFIKHYKIVPSDNYSLSIKVFLKYVDGYPVISNISRISKPGIHIYSSVKELHKYVSGSSNCKNVILSTDHGLITDREAVELNIGGKAIGLIY